MDVKRWIAGAGLGALVAAAFTLAPALNAQQNRGAERLSMPMNRGIGTFTPASADPKLAAVLARAGMTGSGFRFTPSESTRKSPRDITVAVRTRSNRAVRDDRVASAESVSLAPIAYNLGVSVGWKRFAVSGDVAKIDMAGQPGSREMADIGISYTGNRASARIKAGAERPTGDVPALVAVDPSYSIDVGSSYSLTRNLDVTAGLRYKSERERLPRIADDRRDSQAVYVGTAFRF